MKITHIIIGLGIGGAELMLKRLVEGLNGKDGMQHSIISLTELGSVGKQLQAAGINVKALGMKNALSLPTTFFKLRHELKKQKPDIVQTWMYHADFLGGLTAKSLGINNIIWGIRTTDVTLGRSKLTIALRKLCAWLSYSVPKLIVCAADAGRQVHENVGYDASNMRVIPNGFDLDKLKASIEERDALREEYGLSEEHLVIGSVGRFNPIKNQQVFVDAAALVAAEYVNARFVMVGRDNTWCNKQLVSWIQKHSLQDKFSLLGERSDIPACLSAMDIFCLHSKTEGFPNVLGEAMAMGLPSVATDVGDAKILLGEAGKTVHPSTQGVATGLLELLKLDKNVLIDMGFLAHERIHENYSLPIIMEQYSNLYKSLILK